MHLQFQTSDLVPPPYSYAIEINAKEKSGKLEVEFELTYMDRDSLSKNEIEDEGFSNNDDFKWTGLLNASWLFLLKKQ